MNERIVRIGGASGAWGDSPMGPEQLLAAGVDYLVMDFLAEVTIWRRCAAAACAW